MTCISQTDCQNTCENCVYSSTNNCYQCGVGEILHNPYVIATIVLSIVAFILLSNVVIALSRTHYFQRLLEEEQSKNVKETTQPDIQIAAPVVPAVQSVQ